MIRTTAILATIASVATTALAGPEEPDVRALLKAADKATKAVEAVSYKAKFYGTGAYATKSDYPTVKGEMLVVKNLDNDYLPMKGHAKGQVWPVGEAEAHSFFTAFDGTTAYSLDEGEKKLTTGKGGTGARLLEVSEPLFMLEYAHPSPFTDEINAKLADHEGQVVIGDVLCDVIYVEYGGQYGDAKARWYFGVEDHLPRKVERLRQAKGRAASYVTVLWDLEVNPDYSPSDLSIEAPSGYALDSAADKKEDVVAPMYANLIKTGTKAPGFKLPDANGKKHTLAGYEGNIVLLDFWATWCGPCKAAMPKIQALHEKFSGEKVKVIGLATWERNGDPQGYMDEKGYTYDLLVDADDVAAEYGVPGIPTLVLIDKDGTILHVAVGFGPNEEEHLAKLIKTALKDGGA